ncbi:MAG: hypothetical protein Q8K89_01925 [Actinomycetota bacterium]|nr:hypothetical protein [Actinomycetota bacterium]
MGRTLLIVFLVILFFSVIISSACLVMLHLIGQIERDIPLNLSRAAAAALPNIVMAFPVMLLWSVLWFLLTLVEMLFSARDDEAESDPGTSDIARTVAGFEEFSLSGAFFEALNKGLRMLAFLIYPAIAWEGASPVAAIKRGLGVATAHKTEFATGFVMTELAATIVFVPPGIVFLLSDRAGLQFPQWVWLATILYSAFAWSFTIMLEQLFTAELYLWHLLWRRECTNAAESGTAAPELCDIRPPALTDRLPSLAATAGNVVPR